MAVLTKTAGTVTLVAFGTDGSDWSGATTANLGTANDVRATTEPGKPFAVPGGTDGWFYSDYLDLTNFGFTLPSGALNIKVRVRIQRRRTGTAHVQDAIVQLIKAGTAQGNNKALTATNWPTTEADQYYGSSTVVSSDASTWSLALSHSDVNASNFGVRIQLHGNGDLGLSTNSIGEIDLVEIEVTYDAAQSVTVTGIATGFAAGSPKTTRYARVTGIASAQAMGLPSVVLGPGPPQSVTIAAVASAEALGAAEVDSVAYATPTGIGSGLAFGTFTITQGGGTIVLPIVGRRHGKGSFW